MKIDAEFSLGRPSDIPALSRRAEELGFGAFWVNETKHDPFVQLALASAATKSIEVGTSIALAFTRSPVAIAYASWDLQDVSGGRLILGLGSQVKGHVERRFGMRWESPRAKMKEAVGLVRSTWDSWQTGGRLDFQGRFYRVDLMTPFFSPGKIDHPRIPIFLAGVNRGMCSLAGEVGDGLHVHPLHTTRYLREVVIPSVEKGRRSSGRRRSEFTVAASVFAAVGSTREEVQSVRETLRGQVAFYASTRAYRPMMDLHGWGDVAEKLRLLSLAGEWEKMAEEVSDDVLGEFVVDGLWDEVGERIVAKYSGLVDRVRLYLPFDGDEAWSRVVAPFTE